MGEIFLISQFGNLLNIYGLSQLDLSVWTISKDLHAQKPFNRVPSTDFILLLKLVGQFINLILSVLSIRNNNIVYIKEDQDAILSIAAGFI